MVFLHWEKPSRSTLSLGSFRSVAFHSVSNSSNIPLIDETGPSSSTSLFFCPSPPRERKQAPELWASSPLQQTIFTHFANSKYSNFIDGNSVSWSNYKSIISVQMELESKFTASKTQNSCVPTASPRLWKWTNHSNVLIKKIAAKICDWQCREKAVIRYVSCVHQTLTCMEVNSRTTPTNLVRKSIYRFTNIGSRYRRCFGCMVEEEGSDLKWLALSI